MTLATQDVLGWTGARNISAALAGTLPASLSGWSIDSRTIAPGDVYVALRGETHDGHDFVPAALERGAALAIVDRDKSRGPRTVLVEDTLRALQSVAQKARAAWDGTVVGITGSAGKTSTKDAVAHLLATRFPVGKTVGNLNNHIGVPLSILRLPSDCRMAVLEMGMNHAGEIQALSAIARPEIGVVTNVGYAHVEFFDSIDSIAAAKRELIEALPDSGTAVLNADDERVLRFRDAHRGRTVTYGTNPESDVRAERIEWNENGSQFRCGGVAFETPLAGRHGVLNTLAAIATAFCLGIPVPDVADASRTIPVGKMRGERFERNGVTVLNDSYNANPEAMNAMLDVLAATPGRRRIAVLGEMRELGNRATALHFAVGEHVAETGVDLLFGIGDETRALVEGAIAGGLSAARAFLFDDSQAAGDALKSVVQPGDAILFKGSRAVRVELALGALLEAAA